MTRKPMKNFEICLEYLRQALRFFFYFSIFFLLQVECAVIWSDDAAADSRGKQPMMIIRALVTTACCCLAIAGWVWMCEIGRVIYHYAFIKNSTTTSQAVSLRKGFEYLQKSISQSSSCGFSLFVVMYSMHGMAWFPQISLCAAAILGFIPESTRLAATFVTQAVVNNHNHNHNNNKSKGNKPEKEEESKKDAAVMDEIADSACALLPQAASDNFNKLKEEIEKEEKEEDCYALDLETPKTKSKKQGWFRWDYRLLLIPCLLLLMYNLFVYPEQMRAHDIWLGCFLPLGSVAWLCFQTKSASVPREATKTAEAWPSSSIIMIVPRKVAQEKAYSVLLAAMPSMVILSLSVLSTCMPAQECLAEKAVMQQQLNALASFALHGQQQAAVTQEEAMMIGLGSTHLNSSIGQVSKGCALINSSQGPSNNSNHTSILSSLCNDEDTYASSSYYYYFAKNRTEKNQSHAMQTWYVYYYHQLDEALHQFLDVWLVQEKYLNQAHNTMMSTGGTTNSSISGNHSGGGGGTSYFFPSWIHSYHSSPGDLVGNGTFISADSWERMLQDAAMFIANQSTAYYDAIAIPSAYFGVETIEVHSVPAIFALLVGPMLVWLSLMIAATEYLQGHIQSVLALWMMATAWKGLFIQGPDALLILTFIFIKMALLLAIGPSETFGYTDDNESHGIDFIGHEEEEATDSEQVVVLLQDVSFRMDEKNSGSPSHDAKQSKRKSHNRQNSIHGIHLQPSNFSIENSDDDDGQPS